MSKGLEALEELRENGAVSFSRATISFTYLAFTKRADIIEKELKALEIVREKKVNVCCFCEYNVDTYKDYIETFKKVNLGKELLIQEEYDLLKEVLL